MRKGVVKRALAFKQNAVKRMRKYWFYKCSVKVGQFVWKNQVISKVERGRGNGHRDRQLMVWVEEGGRWLFV